MRLLEDDKLREFSNDGISFAPLEIRGLRSRRLRGTKQSTRPHNETMLFDGDISICQIIENAAKLHSLLLYRISLKIKHKISLLIPEIKYGERM